MLLTAGREVTIVDSMVAAVTDGREYEVAPNARVHRVSIAAYLAQGGSFKDADIVATTQQVVEECVEHDVALISFSSAEVYGRSGISPSPTTSSFRTHHNARLEYAIAKT